MTGLACGVCCASSCLRSRSTKSRRSRSVLPTPTWFGVRRSTRTKATTTMSNLASGPPSRGPSPSGQRTAHTSPSLPPSRSLLTPNFFSHSLLAHSPPLLSLCTFRHTSLFLFIFCPQVCGSWPRRSTRHGEQEHSPSGASAFPGQCLRSGRLPGSAVDLLMTSDAAVDGVNPNL